MSSDEKMVFNKDNLETILKELAKEYRNLGGRNVPAELILIGGASVLINYGFREMTMDIDAVIQAASIMKEAINHVGDEFDLPNGWLNDDFRRTESYSSHLSVYSTYYKTYSNVLTIRTVSAKYLIAMKLKSGRQYKNDLSDVLGILAEHEKKNDPISLEQIKTAVVNLYDCWEALPESSITFIENAMKDGDFSKLYSEVTASEKSTRDSLLTFDDQYPGALTEANTDEIIAMLRQRQRQNKDDPER